MKEPVLQESNLVELKTELNDKFELVVTFDYDKNVVQQYKHPVEPPVKHPVEPPAENLSADEVQILNYCSVPKSKNEIAEMLGFKDAKGVRRRHITPLVQQGLLAMTIPDKPNSSKQKYITAKKGNHNET